MNTEDMHVYDWLDLPPKDDAERDAKEWLNQFVKPAHLKDPQWLARYRVTVEWNGKRYICSGASSMGDVWLKSEGSSSFYDHRVDVTELSGWKRLNHRTTNNTPTP